MREPARATLLRRPPGAGGRGRARGASPALPRRATLGGLAAMPLAAPRAAGQAPPRLVILGGGFGGASAARFTRDTFPEASVTLIERARSLVTCPFSNLVLGGLRTIGDITFSYDGLARRGVGVVHDEASAIDPGGRRVHLSGGSPVPYDRLIVSPGIDLRWDAIEGYTAAAAERMPHCWVPYLQPITALARQLQAMPDGGVFVMTIPPLPYRCPPAPYERISMVAHHLGQAKPRSKVLALDAKDGFPKQPLFAEAWRELYDPMIEWVAASEGGRVTGVDPAAMTVTAGAGEVHKGDVVNVIPPQMAARIAHAAGLTDRSGWCPVHAGTLESRLVPGIHVIGDAAITAPMPKSGSAAAAQGRQAAAAAIMALRGMPPPEPAYFSACHSRVAPEYGISAVGSYRVDHDAFVEEPQPGGPSPRNEAMAPNRRGEQRRLEALQGEEWYRSITREMFGLD